MFLGFSIVFSFSCPFSLERKEGHVVFVGRSVSQSSVRRGEKKGKGKKVLYVCFLLLLLLFLEGQFSIISTPVFLSFPKNSKKKGQNDSVVDVCFPSFLVRNGFVPSSTTVSFFLSSSSHPATRSEWTTSITCSSSFRFVSFRFVSFRFVCYSSIKSRSAIISNQQSANVDDDFAVTTDPRALMFDC